MALRDEILKKIERKRREISDLDTKLKAAAVYIQALEDTLKLIPPNEVEDEADLSPSVTPSSADALRSGSKNDRARQILRAAGQPLHVSKILELMREKDDADSRAALVGSLGAYVRDKKIFTRPGPNTFGLLEFDDSTPQILPSSDLRARLYASLVEAKNMHLADAVENSEVVESADEVVFTTSKVFQMFLKDPVLDAAVKGVTGRPVRVTVKIGIPGGTAPSVTAPRPPKGFGVDPPKVELIGDDEPTF